MVEALRLEGVDTIFGLVGSAFMDPLDIFARADIRFIQVRHEQSAALMAEGYGRAAGRPGVCVGQNGPGVTNLTTGVASAFSNHTPMVVLTPTVTSQTQGTRAFQEVDQIRLFEPITTWQTRVNRPDRIGEAVRSAFRAAIATRGPAQIDIPRDYYYGTFEEDEIPPKAYRTDGRYGGGAGGGGHGGSRGAACRREARIPGWNGRSRRRRTRSDRSARRALRGAGRVLLHAQRFIPGEPSPPCWTDRISGFDGSDATSFGSGRRTRFGHAS